MIMNFYLHMCKITKMNESVRQASGFFSLAVAKKSLSLKIFTKLKEDGEKVTLDNVTFVPKAWRMGKNGVKSYKNACGKCHRNFPQIWGDV